MRNYRCSLCIPFSESFVLFTQRPSLMISSYSGSFSFASQRSGSSDETNANEEGLQYTYASMGFKSEGKSVQKGVRKKTEAKKKEKKLRRKGI